MKIRRYALIGLLIAGSAAAQQPTPAQTSAIKQSCRSDYMSFCSSVPTGGKASLNCLHEHLTDLSPPCQSAVGAVVGGGPAQAPAGMQAAPPPRMPMREEAMLLRRSCGGDFRAYCQGVAMGGGRALACLNENQSRLSPACKGAVAEAR